MSSQALNIPDAVDLDASTITPSRELEACNEILNDFEALTAFYEENGYLFFRNVLNPESVERARNEMLAVAADMGLVERGDPSGRWTGKPLDKPIEEDPQFAGISRRLIEHPENLKLMEKLLGEPACIVPNVQYRIYPPNGPVTMVHQDGFYSPGIQDYKPVWIPLVPCEKALGGLMVAVGQHKRGYFHNVAKPAPFPIPNDQIDEKSWATADYQPGDVLIVHPYSPHGSMPNTSDRLRVTLDTRVQSASHPNAFNGMVREVTPTSITVSTDTLGELTLDVDEETFIRVLDPGIREQFSGFADYTKPGMQLLVVRDGNKAVMLRRGTQA